MNIFGISITAAAIVVLYFIAQYAGEVIGKLPF